MRTNSHNNISICTYYKALTIVLTITIIFSLGCWYSFSERAYAHIKSVGVIPFENETAEYELASQATDLLTSKILSTSTYELASPDDADAIVSGRIIRYEREVNTYDESEDAIDYIVRVHARVKFYERVTGNILWEQTIQGFDTFPVDGDEDESKTKAVQLLVDMIYDKLKSG